MLKSRKNRNGFKALFLSVCVAVMLAGCAASPETACTAPESTPAPSAESTPAPSAGTAPDNSLTVGHDWTDMDCAQDTLNLFFRSLGTDWYSENTVESPKSGAQSWVKAYSVSTPHREAMLSPDTVYVGCSLTYCDNVPCRNSDHRVVEFDVFARELTTALHP